MLTGRDVNYISLTTHMVMEATEVAKMVDSRGVVVRYLSPV